MIIYIFFYLEVQNMLIKFLFQQKIREYKKCEKIIFILSDDE